MGYYSKVALSLYKDDFVEMVSKAREEEGSEPLELIKAAVLFANENIITLFWDYIKWYEGYFKDIDFIMSFVHEDDRQYVFKRSGEAFDDYEEKSNGDNNGVLYSEAEFYTGVDVFGDRYNRASSYIDELTADKSSGSPPPRNDCEYIEEVSSEELLSIIDA